MTAKEKAKQLVEKCLKASLWMYQAKECALITAEECLNIMKNEYSETTEAVQYWHEVKKEINLI